MVIGTGIVFCAQASQLYMWTSVPQIDVFVTRMRTSSVPTLGTGTSSSHSPGSARLFTTACIVFCTRKKLGESWKQERRKSLTNLACRFCVTKFLSVEMMQKHARNA